MACPTCGGTRREQLAPGFWRCTEVIVHRSGGPGLTDPHRGPMVLESTAPCGTEYQEGQGAIGSLCGCGTFAVGICASCGQAICGAHSGLFKRRRLCGDCRRSAEAAAVINAQAEREADHEERLAAWQEKHGQWREGCAAILDPLPVPARVAVVMRLAIQSGSLDTPDGIRFQGGILDVLLPEQFPRSGPSVTTLPACPDKEIAAWFASAAKEPPRRIRVRTRHTIFGGFKEVCTNGWDFPTGSAMTLQRGDSAPWFTRAAISVAGDRIYDRPGEVHPDDRFNAIALRQMAIWADLPTLAEPPPPPPNPNARGIFG